MIPTHKRFSYNDYSPLYEEYYTRQCGGSLDGFEGALYQKGYGLGSLFRGLFRSALPLMKRGIKTIGKEALKSGVLVAHDVISGESPRNAVKKRMTNAVSKILGNNQKGSGIRKRKRSTRKQSSSKVKRRRMSHDIFD